MTDTRTAPVPARASHPVQLSNRTNPRMQLVNEITDLLWAGYYGAVSDDAD